MKKLLTFALTLMVLAIFTGLGAAQQKGEERKPRVRGAFEETRQSAPGKGGVKLDKPVLEMTGKVIQVNPGANTFTVMAKGQSVTFIAQAPGELTLFKVGQILDITYTETTGGMKKATTINTSKSNTY